MGMAIQKCCSSLNPCEKHKAKMSPELLKLLEKAKTEAEADKIINKYIADAFARGEWKF